LQPCDIAFKDTTLARAPSDKNKTDDSDLGEQEEENTTDDDLQATIKARNSTGDENEDVDVTYDDSKEGMETNEGNNLLGNEELDKEESMVESITFVVQLSAEA
jgi:hypothetical protein